MSLTSFIKENEDVKERFKVEFPKPKFAVQKERLAEPIREKSGTVGTAFDYALRFLTQRLNPGAIGREQWVAEDVVDLLEEDASPLLPKARQITLNARQRLATYLETAQMSDALIESALLLATLDPIQRRDAGREFVGVLHPEDVLDLKNLLSAIDDRTFTAKSLCLLNPTFGAASRLVGGADADLVIDDTLIDIKTKKELTLDRASFDQLLGYYTLHHIGGIGGIQPSIHINKLAIYFARYGYLHTMEVSDLIDSTKFPDFVNWFRQRATAESG